MSKCRKFHWNKDERQSQRILFGRDFTLDEILDCYHEMDSRRHEISEGDVVAIAGGAYHIEVSRGLDVIAKEAMDYAKDYSGMERVNMIMRFIKRNYISDYSQKFNYNVYKGRALDLKSLAYFDLLNSTDASVLLSFVLNSDPETRKQGFRSYVVSGQAVNWWGKMVETTGVKLESERGSFLLVPSESKVEEITGLALPGSLNGGYVEAYTSSDDRRLLMLACASKIYRRDKSE